MNDEDFDHESEGKFYADHHVLLSPEPDGRLKKVGHALMVGCPVQLTFALEYESQLFAVQLDVGQAMIQVAVGAPTWPSVKFGKWSVYVSFFFLDLRLGWGQQECSCGKC